MDALLERLQHAYNQKRILQSTSNWGNIPEQYIARAAAHE